MPESTETEPETAPHAADDSDARLSIIGDLERRIHELEQMAEESFGRFTRLDWFFCVAGSLLAPGVLYLWFWP